MRSGKESNPGPGTTAKWGNNRPALLAPLFAQLRASTKEWRFLTRVSQAEHLSDIAPKATNTTVFNARFFMIHWDQLGTSDLLDGDGSGAQNQAEMVQPLAPVCVDVTNPPFSAFSASTIPANSAVDLDGSCDCTAAARKADNDEPVNNVSCTMHENCYCAV